MVPGVAMVFPSRSAMQVPLAVCHMRVVFLQVVALCYVVSNNIHRKRELMFKCV